MPRARQEAFAAEREILEAWIRSDSSRPVYSAFRNAFIEKFARLYVLVTKVSGPSSSIYKRTAQELDSLDAECMKLAEVLFSRPNLWVARDWRKPAILKFLLRSMRRARGGRPLTKFAIAAQAKELRLLDRKRWTWPKLAARFCDCGKEHMIKCQDNLRREILHVEKFLRESGYALDLGKTR